jgi:hypothetical protein
MLPEIEVMAKNLTLMNLTACDVFQFYGDKFVQQGMLEWVVGRYMRNIDSGFFLL